jgi:large subunit ribosomal protein L23
MQINQIIIRPIITEKATRLVQSSVYTFEVHEKANKFQVEKTLSELYGVKISQISIVKRKGKTRRVGRRMKTKQLPDMKIAYVTVKEGKLSSLFPQA